MRLCDYGLPAWLCGGIRTAAAVAWALASNLQGRYSERISERAATGIGAVLLATGGVADMTTV